MRKKRKWKHAGTFTEWLSIRAQAPNAGLELRALVDVLQKRHASALDVQLAVYLRECRAKLYRPKERLIRESVKQRNSRIMRGRLERNRAPNGRASGANAPAAISEVSGGVLAGEKNLDAFRSAGLTTGLC